LIYKMIKAPKVIVTTQEKLVVGTRTLGAPLHEHEVGRTMSSGRGTYFAVLIKAEKTS